jgi:predicted MFS family arabinose efflux permease
MRDLLPGVPPDQRWLLLMPIGAAICVTLAMRLSRKVEISAEVPPDARGLRRSRNVVRRLAALFAVDAFAGGFIVQTFMVFWFGRQFGADAELMGLAFFGVGLLQAGSSVAAGWLGARIGLLNTMVFTHLPSNVFLALIAFAPTLGVAIVLLLARSVLSQMDVPARQAYVAALVDPAERTAAAGYTNAARHVVRPAGPALASVSMAMGAGLPFLVAGGLKAVYDLALYFTFRRVRLGDD